MSNFKQALKDAVVKGITDAVTHRITLLAAGSRIEGQNFRNFQDGLPTLKALHDLAMAAIDERFSE